MKFVKNWWYTVVYSGMHWYTQSSGPHLNIIVLAFLGYMSMCIIMPHYLVQASHVVHCIPVK